jgi:hypothetical protein
VPSGRLYRRCRGQLTDALYVAASAFYLTERNAVLRAEDPR